MTLVHRRHVIYVQGYDPRGLAEYHRMFRAEYQSFCKLYRLKGNIGQRAEASDRFSTAWPVVTEGNGWRVDTTYEFLRWEDIIRRDFARPAWWAILQGLRALIVATFDLTFPRIMRAHWRFGLFLAYPLMVLLGFTLLSALFGLLITIIAASMMSSAIVPAILGI